MARRVLRGLLLLEAAGLLGALLLYRAMDRSQGAAGRAGAAPRRGRGAGRGGSSARRPPAVPAEHRAPPGLCKEMPPRGVRSWAWVSAGAREPALGFTSEERAAGVVLQTQAREQSSGGSTPGTKRKPARCYSSCTEPDKDLKGREAVRK